MDLPKNRLKAIDREIRKRQKSQARRVKTAGYSSEKEYANSGRTSRAYWKTRLEITKLHAKSNVYWMTCTKNTRPDSCVAMI